MTTSGSDLSTSTLRRLARTPDALAPDELAAVQLTNARANHAACVRHWDRLSDDVRRGTTIHGLDAHLPTGHPARQP